MGIDAQMLVKIRPAKPLTQTDVRRMAADLHACVGPAVSVYRDVTWIDDVADRHCLRLVDGAWDQDGPAIEALPGEQLIDVRLSSRYYGVGYERGHLPGIIEVAEWLETRLAPHQPEILYGGDSSGVLAEPFDRTARQALYAHYVEKGHEPYSGAFGRDRDGMTCDFCVGRPMNNSGGGGGTTFFACSGCGWRVERDNVTGAMAPYRTPFLDEDTVGTDITQIKALDDYGVIAVVRGYAFVDHKTGRITVLRSVCDLLDTLQVTDADLRASVIGVVNVKGGVHEAFDWRPGHVDPTVANVIDAAIAEARRRRESKPRRRKESTK